MSILNLWSAPRSMAQFPFQLHEMVIWSTILDVLLFFRLDAFSPSCPEDAGAQVADPLCLTMWGASHMLWCKFYGANKCPYWATRASLRRQFLARKYLSHSLATLEKQPCHDKNVENLKVMGISCRDLSSTHTHTNTHHHHHTTLPPVSLEERKPLKEDRFLHGRQIAYMIHDYFWVTVAHGTILDLFTITPP